MNQAAEADVAIPGVGGEAPSFHDIVFNVTPRQREMIENPARTLWVGAGTKTGKTVAAAIWIAIGILQGEHCAWCGPWSARTRTGYRKVKAVLDSFIRAGIVKANDSTMRLECLTNGGSFEPFTGDNPQGIFGDGVSRFVIDEASRQSEASYTAAMTTTSAARGSIRLLFNLDLGGQNWAISNLLRVQAMTDVECAASDESFMLFPTGDGGIVPPEEIERVRLSGMPKPMFEALYLAKIPDTDLNLFHNLNWIFSQGGPAPEKPRPGNAFIAGLDLARKHDWTALTVMDASLMKVIAFQRFHRIDWQLQYAKIKSFCDYWDVSKVLLDCTGIGDPIESQLREMGMNVEGYQFTEKSRDQLVEGLVTACDQKLFTVCTGPQFDVLKAELTNFQIVLDGKRVRYGVLKGDDDAAISLMLTWALYKTGGYGPFQYGRVVEEEEMRDKNWDSF